MFGSSKSEGSTVGAPSDHTLLLAESLQICGLPCTVQPPTMSTVAYGSDEVPIDVLFFPWYTPPMYTEPVCAAGGIRLTLPGRAEVAADPDVLDREVDGAVRVDARGALVVDDEAVVGVLARLLVLAPTSRRSP